MRQRVHTVIGGSHQHVNLREMPAVPETGTDPNEARALDTARLQTYTFGIVPMGFAAMV